MRRLMDGTRAVLSRPGVYSAFQRAMGGDEVRAWFVDALVRPRAGMRILDLGCGPADILEFLPDVDYWGFDVSARYIERASTRFGHRARFRRQELSSSDVEALPPFDAVFALGLLHHLDDEAAGRVVRLAHQALEPGGRLLTVDPCFAPGQRWMARALVSMDRGRHVRDQDGYQALVRACFGSVRAQVRHKSWVPYTHCFMECSR